MLVSSGEMENSSITDAIVIGITDASAAACCWQFPACSSYLPELNCWLRCSVQIAIQWIVLSWRIVSWLRVKVGEVFSCRSSLPCPSPIHLFQITRISFYKGHDFSHQRSKRCRLPGHGQTIRGPLNWGPHCSGFASIVGYALAGSDITKGLDGEALQRLDLVSSRCHHGDTIFARALRFSLALRSARSED